VLAPDDARRAGFNPAELRFDAVAQTANGTAPIAYIMVPELEVGDFIVRDVPAAVAGDGLTQSLLGMSLLKRLEGFTVTGDTMELKPPRY
jgi:aspartyl protease family protein